MFATSVIKGHAITPQEIPYLTPVQMNINQHRCMAAYAEATTETEPTLTYSGLNCFRAYFELKTNWMRLFIPYTADICFQIILNNPLD